MMNALNRCCLDRRHFLLLPCLLLILLSSLTIRSESFPSSGSLVSSSVAPKRCWWVCPPSTGSVVHRGTSSAAFIYRFPQHYPPKRPVVDEHHSQQRRLFHPLSVRCQQVVAGDSMTPLSSSSLSPSLASSTLSSLETTSTGATPTTTATATDGLLPPTSTPSSVSRSSVIKNFRPVRIVVPAKGQSPALSPFVYRCAKPDNLTQLLLLDPEDAAPRRNASSALLTTKMCHHPHDRLMLYEVGLVLDLRSESERDDAQCRQWWSNAPGGPFVVVDSVTELEQSLRETRPVVSGKTLPRHVLRLDPLNPIAFMQYLEVRWMTRRERLAVAWYRLVDGNAWHDLRIRVLNRRGLLGLNQAILEAGASHLCQALQALTLHAEACQASSSSLSYAPAVVHCVQGKDRTGMVCLCIQSLLGVSDDDIVTDYAASESELASGSAAMARAYPGLIDKQFFAGAPPHVMRDTLQWLRDEYGSVDTYLNAIGFDASWQQRFVNSVGAAAHSKTISKL